MSNTTSQDLARALAAVRRHFFSAGVFSLAVNLLFLAGPIYMLQVYDRVVSSGSVTTLVMLTLALVIAYLALAGLDTVRARVLSRAGVRLDTMLAARVVTATLEQPDAGTLRSQPLRDLDTFRQFITGPGIHALFDVPWVPIYLLMLFMLHPLLGGLALGGSLLIGVLALINELLTRRTLAEANSVATRNYAFTDMSLRNAEVVRAMGMATGLVRRWSRDRDRMIERQLTASDRAAEMQSIIKFVRLAMQSLILGLGAFLVIERMATAGVMFAASILLGRAMQPIEQAVGGWRGFVGARDSYARVKALLATQKQKSVPLILPRPSGRLSARQAVFVPPGSNKPVLKGVSFFISAGETLGIVGPSGAGKSTLARMIIGVTSPTSGSVRLDGADISVWPKDQLGAHVGYLPQDIELFADTVAGNISRFGNGSDEQVIAAAKLAGVHEMILELPNGYDTEVGEGGAVLSGGYRQRIGLARAVFGNPSLVVLDEPSSNLDTAGDFALADCIGRLKQQGATVVIVSHRITTISSVDKLLVLRDGQVDVFGERQEVVARLSASSPLRAVPSAPAVPQVPAAGAR
ncbi:MAG: type I secretion system permease/ATPase [Devosia sp.]